eukprot:12759-Heterococcus_DN1.PRE.2
MVKKKASSPAAKAVPAAQQQPAGAKPKKGKAAPPPTPEPQEDSVDESLDSEESGEDSSGSDEESSADEADAGNGAADSDSDDSEGFEDQGSDSDDDDVLRAQAASDSEEEQEDEEEDGVASASAAAGAKESTRHTWSAMDARDLDIAASKRDGSLAAAKHLHVDDLSSDDDEDNRNTIGRVPLHWYDEYDHIGYDRTGAKVMKGPVIDGVDAALAARDDPNFTRTVYDAYNDRRVVLSDRELELVRRLQAGAFPHPEFAAEEDYSDYFTYKVEQSSIQAGDEPKRRFLPSKWEAMRVHKLVQHHEAFYGYLYASLLSLANDAKSCLSEYCARLKRFEHQICLVTSTLTPDTRSSNKTPCTALHLLHLYAVHCCRLCVRAVSD